MGRNQGSPCHPQTAGHTGPPTLFLGPFKYLSSAGFLRVCFPPRFTRDTPSSLLSEGSA